MSIQQGVELFHLVFLSFLGKKLDKQQYVLKGGCNLRFFFGSPRYSEDMDLDLGEAPVHVARDRVNAILDSSPFQQALATGGLAIEHVTEHKQTETTQRWKIGLLVSATSGLVPTKIEFSRRGVRHASVIERVLPTLLHTYRMSPFMAPHYPGEVALLHKIEALATRSVTQARDVFDFYLLHSKERMQAILPRTEKPLLESALRNALSLSFDDFKGQVLAYMGSDDQAAYDSPESWEAMQVGVIDMLERPHEVN